MCSSLLIHRRSHSAVVSKITLTTQSWGWEESVESGVNRVFFPATQCPGKHVAGRGQTHKHQTTLSVTAWERSGQHKEALCRVRSASMYAQEIARGCVHNVTKSLLLLCEYFKCSFEKQINSLQSIWRHDFYRDSTAFSHTDNRLQGGRDILSGLLEWTGFILSS